MKKILVISVCMIGIMYAKASQESMDCKLSKKSGLNYLICDNKAKGYPLEQQKINEFEIRYKDEKSETKIITLYEPTTISDLGNSQIIKSFLSKKGIVSFTNAEVSYLNIRGNTPLYRDPEMEILSSGCQFKSAPVVISYPKENICDDILCMGAVECIEGKIRTLRDAICNAVRTKEGVYCPEANDCLVDDYVQILPYSYEKAGSSNSEGNKNIRSISK